MQFHGYRLNVSAHEQSKQPEQASPQGSSTGFYYLIGKGEAGSARNHDAEKRHDSLQASGEAPNPFKTHRPSNSNSASGEALPSAAHTSNLFPQILTFPQKLMTKTSPIDGFGAVKAKHGPVSAYAHSPAASESGRKPTKKRVEAEVESRRTDKTLFRTTTVSIRPQMLRRGQWYQFGRESPRDKPQ